MKHGEARFLSCMYVLSLLLLAGFAANGLRSAAAVSAETAVPVVIVLDPGHGGMDGGAAGADGTLESSLNLSIALKTDAVLGLLGEQTLLTRSTDADLSGPEAKTISQKKVSDIRRRVEIVNSQAGALLLNIHCNTYSEEKYHGAQVFYTGTASKALAEVLQEALQAHVDPGNTRKAKTISPDVYLMKHITAPGVLLECGFLSNPAELRNLKDPGYQNRLAVTIAVTAAGYRPENFSGV